MESDESDEELLEPRTVKDVFRDFKRRRVGIVEALTTDYQEFREKCDPEEDNLCLYGLPCGAWEVKEPDDEVPPYLPEPVRGINFARDAMPEKDWLALVAVRSDLWLLSVAYVLGARFDKVDRQRLFTMINGLPTIFEVVSGKAEINTTCRKEAGPCGVCGINDVGDKFLVHCFYCKLRYHGKCVNISRFAASRLMIYKCPFCLR